MPTSWRISPKSHAGEPGFGWVYRAFDPELGKDFALKLSKSSDHQVLSEARALAKVKHRNVVTVYGAGEDQGLIGVWMELIEGKRLDLYVKEIGPLDVDEAKEIAKTLCSAVDAVHREGIVHGDIKHNNVIRETSGRLVLLDFGASQDMRNRPTTRRVSTPLFAAPEVLRGEGRHF